MTQEELMASIQELLAAATEYLEAEDQMNGHAMAEQSAPLARSVLEHRVAVLARWVDLMKEATEDPFKQDYAHETALEMLVNPYPVQLLNENEAINPVLAQLLDLSLEFFSHVVRFENAHAA